MEKELKIIIALIVLLLGVIFAMLFFVASDKGAAHVITDDEWDDIAVHSDVFVDSSRWRTYTSEEYAYEMKYPRTWEFNLTDGTLFYPENCVHNAYSKCVARVRIGVYPDAEDMQLNTKCNHAVQKSMRYINSSAWVCDEMMTEAFTASQGYNRKRDYYFKDGRGNVFEVNVMYLHGESVHTEEEMIQTIQLTVQ